MLTARGVTLCAVAVGAWALGRFLGVDELYVVSATVMTIVVLAVAATRTSSARIAVRRHPVARHARPGEPMPVSVSLRNDGRLTASLLLVEDRRPSGIASSDGDAARFVVRALRPRQVTDVRWHAVGTRRGRYTIGPLRIRLRDPFGLAERSRRYRATDEIVVFPPIEPLGRRGAQGVLQGSDTSASQRAFHHGDEFHTMRSYVVGDDLRYVHWPSTAHRGTLMIRQHELPWQARAVVYLDNRAAIHAGVADRSTLERAVSTAASVAVHLQRGRYRVALVTDGQPHRDDETADATLATLAELQAGGHASPINALRVVEKHGDGLLVAVLRPPRLENGAPTSDDGDAAVAMSNHPDVRALQQAGRSYRSRIALIVEYDDQQRCATLAALLRIAGWQAATVTPGTPLASAWERAMVGADIGKVAGARS